MVREANKYKEVPQKQEISWRARKCQEIAEYCICAIDRPSKPFNENT